MDPPPPIDFTPLLTEPDVTIAPEVSAFLTRVVHRLIYSLTKDVVNFTGPGPAFMPVTAENQLDERAAYRVISDALGVQLFRHGDPLDFSYINGLPVYGPPESWEESGTSSVDRERTRNLRLKRGVTASRSKGARLARQLAPRARCLDSLRQGSLLHEFIMAARDSSRPDPPPGGSKPGRGRPPGGTSRDDSGAPRRRGRRRGRISNAEKAAMAQGLL